MAEPVVVQPEQMKLLLESMARAEQRQVEFEQKLDTAVTAGTLAGLGASVNGGGGRGGSLAGLEKKIGVLARKLRLSPLKDHKSVMVDNSLRM